MKKHSITFNKWSCDRCGKWNEMDDFACSCEPDYMQPGGGLTGLAFFILIILMFFVVILFK